MRPTGALLALALLAVPAAALPVPSPGSVWTFEGPASSVTAPEGGAGCPAWGVRHEGAVSARLMDRPSGADAFSFAFLAAGSAPCAARGCVGLGGPDTGWAGVCSDMLPQNQFLVLPNGDGTWRLTFRAELGALGWRLDAPVVAGASAAVPSWLPEVHPAMPVGARYQGPGTYGAIESPSTECGGYVVSPPQPGRVTATFLPTEEAPSIVYWSFVRDGDGCTIARLCVLHGPIQGAWRPQGTCPSRETLLPGTLQVQRQPDGTLDFLASYSTFIGGWGARALLTEAS